MAKTFEVTLGGDKYTLHRFNLGELEDVAELTASMSASRAGFAILKVALRRAEPAIADPSVIEASADELQAAINAIMVASGMKAAAAGEATPAG